MLRIVDPAAFHREVDANGNETFTGSVNGKHVFAYRNAGEAAIVVDTHQSDRLTDEELAEANRLLGDFDKANQPAPDFWAMLHRLVS